MALLPRPVTMMIWSQPELRASSTPYWIMGLSTKGSISLGWALVAGRNRVPRPAAGKTALRTRMFIGCNQVDGKNQATMQTCVPAIILQLNPCVGSQPIHFSVICHPEPIRCAQDRLREGPAFVRIRTKQQQVLRFAQDDRFMGSTSMLLAGHHTRTSLINSLTH